MAERIAVLTGGGDVPGLNACLKGIVNQAAARGIEVLGIRRGWQGLVQLDLGNPATIGENVWELTPERVRTIDRTGGTFLHTSRTNPSRISRDALPEHLKGWPTDDQLVDVTPHIIDVLSRMRVRALIAIGGDDTLSFAVKLHQNGFPVLAIPKTMDNDVHGTEYCIGFSTAVTRSVEIINRLRTNCGSHERIGVIELFGRYCGETSLVASYLAGVDRAIISEVPFDIGRLAEFLKEDRSHNPSNYAIVTVSEGAIPVGGEMRFTGEADPYGHRKLGGISHWIGAEIQARTGVNVIVQVVAYLMRSGAPDSLDLMVANNFANLSLELILKEDFGRLVALRGGVYTSVPIEMVLKGVKRVDVGELYDSENYRPLVRNVAGKPMFLY
jgi:6-phosphofructokinase 1